MIETSSMVRTPYVILPYSMDDSGIQPPCGKEHTGDEKLVEYQEFLKRKRFVLESSGFDIDQEQLNPKLYAYEKDIVRWALKKGKACIFSDCGTGKTAMQLEWACIPMGRSLFLPHSPSPNKQKKKELLSGYLSTSAQAKRTVNRG